MQPQAKFAATKRNPSQHAGFSLIEALVALVILAMVLLATMSLLAQEPFVERRLEAHSEVLEVLDTLHEAIRAGMRLPLGLKRYDWQLLYDPPRTLTTADNLTVWTEVEALSPAGLYKVTLRARYSVGAKSYDRVVETMIWRR